MTLNNDLSNKCPHCLTAFHSTILSSRLNSWIHRGALSIGKDSEGFWWVASENCPACQRLIVWLGMSAGMGIQSSLESQDNLPIPIGTDRWQLARPKGSHRHPVPEDVPEEYASDYREACLVMTDSPKASAALSRRCLQHILQEKADVKNHHNLARAIEEVVGDPRVPKDIRDSLDAVRNIGNFAAHPNKGQKTGEIAEVEPGEAEWCLEVIELLFDFFFVRPAEVQRRKEALNVKLDEMGKPPMSDSFHSSGEEGISS